MFLPNEQMRRVHRLRGALALSSKINSESYVGECIMMNILAVAFGGALGSTARYLAVTVIGRCLPGIDFPYGTLTVNVIGCFLIAFIGGLATDKIPLNAEARFFIFTGILGGFTTFSAFGYETFYFLKTSHFYLALFNILANCLLGLGAVGLGYVTAKSLI